MAENFTIGITITGNGNSATVALKEVAKATDDVDKKARRAGSGVEEANKRMGNSFRALTPHIRTAGAAIGVYFGVSAIRDIIATADAYTEVAARLRIVSGTTAELARAQQQLFQIAQNNRVAFEDAAKLYTRLSSGMRDMGRSQSDTLRVVDLTSKALKISGANTIEAAAALQQFSQALQAGRLNGDEFRSVMENAPRVVKALTDYLGINQGELRKWSEQGKLSSKVVVEALLAAGESIDKEFTKIPVTIGSAWQILGNATKQFIAQIDALTHASQGLSGALQMLGEKVQVASRLMRESFPKSDADRVTAYTKELARLYEQQAKLEARMSESFWTKPIDQTVMDPQRLSDVNKQIGQLEGRLGQMASRQQGTADAGFFPAQKTADDYVKAAEQAWKLDDAQKAVAKSLAEIAMARGFDPAFLISIAKAETSLGKLNKESAKGAQGIMQFMPGTAKQYGVKDPWNLEDAANGAIKMLSEMEKKFGDVRLAAAAYNAGAGNVTKYGNQVPPFAETRGYVDKVVNGINAMNAAMGRNAEVIASTDKENKAFYDLQIKRIEALKATQSAASDATYAQKKAEVEKLKQLAEDAGKNADIRVRMAIDSQSLDQALNAIETARAKQAEYLQDAASLSSQGVIDARRNLRQIEQEIVETRKTGNFYGEKELELTAKRNQAESRLKEEKIKAGAADSQLQAALAENNRTWDQERLTAMKALADANVQMEADRRKALEDEISLQQQLSGYQLDVAQQAATGAKAAIDSKVQEAQAQFALAEAERQQLMEGRTGLDQVQQARANLNQKLQESIALIEIERQSALDKLGIDERILRFEEEMVRLRAESAQSAQDRAKAEADLAVIQVQQAANASARANIEVNAEKEIAKARQEATKANQGLDTKEVRESQLRMNAYWDQYMGRLQDYASLWREITGDTEDGFSRMAVAMGEYAKQSAQISDYYRDNPKAFGDFTVTIEGIQQGQAAISAMAKTMLALRSNYSEGTKGYEDMTNAAERMMEVQRALQVVEGVLAVIHQLSSGDVYTAIPRALGVAAMIGSIGVSVNASGSNSGVGGSGYVDQSGVNGGVFGDSEAQGDILSALEIIRDNSSNDLNYSAEMLKALRNIESGLSGVSNSLIRTIYPSAVAGLGSKSFDAQVNPLNSISDPLTKALHSIIMSTTTKISGYGIQSWAQSLDKIIANGLGAASFTEITKTTKIIGITVGKSVKNIYDWSGASEAARQFTKVIKGIADTIKAGGEAFGMAGDQVMKKIGNVQIDLGRIDLKGLSGKEIQEKLSAEFDRIASQLAKKAMPNLGQFQQIGESYFKTYIRVAEGINRATGELERLGVTAINFRDIANKQGDVAAEIVRQSLMAQNGLADGVRQYIDALDGSAEDVIDAYKKLIAASNLLKTAGIGDTNLDRTMINAAGGLDAFNEAMQAFNDNFLTDAQRYAGDMRVLSEAFAKLGYTLPDSKDAFRDIVLGIDTSTEAGRKLFGRMIALSDAFAKAAGEADKLREKYADKLDPLANIRKQIEQVGIDFNKLLLNAIAPIQSRGDKRIADLMRGTVVGDLNDMLKNKKAREDEIARLEQQIADETAKKKPNNKLLVQLRKDLDYAKDQLMTTTASIDAINSAIADIDAQIQAIQGDTAEEIARAKAPLLDAAAQVMTETLADIFQSLEQSIRQAQQRLQSVLDFQRNLENQIAQMRGSSAVAALANSRYAQASGAVRDYKAGLTNQSVRNVDLEMKLLGDLQTAIMDRYNAEQALLQEQVQAQADALNERLQIEIEAINAATRARVDAINKELEAQIKAQQKADEAVIKAQQKANDRVVKEQQKVYDKEIKALQKKHDLELAGLQKELDAANKLKDAIKNVAEYAKSMLLGPQSTISPEARLAEARRQYQDTLARANSGDAEAMSQLTNASDAYLEAAKQYYGSSTQYQNIFDGVRQAMEQIGGMSAPDPNSIQSRIDALREQQAEQLDALREIQQEQLDLLRENQQDQIDAIRESQQGSIDAMRESVQQQIEAIQKAAQSQIDAAQKSTQQAIADLSDPNKNAAMRALRDATVAELQEVARLSELTRQEAARQAEEAKRQAQEQAQEAIRMAQDQLRLLDENARLSAAQLSALNAMLRNMGLTPEPTPAYARGGYAQAGMALVGEQGPELVRFERPAQVMTADDTRNALTIGNSEKVAKAIAELKDEMRASVTVQSNAYPLLIEEIRQLRQRVEDMERQQRIKA